MSAQPLPVVLTLRGSLLALHPETGAMVWQRDLAAPAYRLFVADTWIFVAVGELEPEGTLLRFDRSTGAPSGAIELGFRASAGVLEGGRLYLASRYGAACVTTQGAVLWRAKLSGMMTASQQLIATDASGRELWRAGFPVVNDVANVGLVVGDTVAQPDTR